MENLRRWQEFVIAFILVACCVGGEFLAFVFVDPRNKYASIEFVAIFISGIIIGLGIVGFLLKYFKEQNVRSSLHDKTSCKISL